MGVVTLVASLVNENAYFAASFLRDMMYCSVTLILGRYLVCASTIAIAIAPHNDY